MGDSSDPGHENSHAFVASVTERRQQFEEWLQEREEIYKRLHRPDIPEPLVSAVEAFRLDQTFGMYERRQPDSPESEFVFIPDSDWKPNEDEGASADDPQLRARVVHDVLNGPAEIGLFLHSAGEALAVILYERLCEVEESERQGAAPVRVQGQLSRRAIADVAYDLLTSGMALCSGAPGPGVLRLLEKLLGVEDRRHQSNRRFQARQAAIEIEAKEPGLTSRKLGDLVGVDSSTITRWRKKPGYRSAVEQARHGSRQE